MKKVEQGFIIDRLTDSILNTISGDSFQTEISTLKKLDLNNISKKIGWNLPKNDSRYKRSKIFSTQIF